MKMFMEKRHQELEKMHGSDYILIMFLATSAVTLPLDVDRPCLYFIDES